MEKLTMVDDSLFTSEERNELLVMNNDTRALARFLGSILIRTAQKAQPAAAKLSNGRQTKLDDAVGSMVESPRQVKPNPDVKAKRTGGA